MPALPAHAEEDGEITLYTEQVVLQDTAVRTEPSTSAAEVATLPVGSIVQVAVGDRTQDAGGAVWVRVLIPEAGWVRGADVGITSVLTTSNPAVLAASEPIIDEPVLLPISGPMGPVFVPPVRFVP